MSNRAHPYLPSDKYRRVFMDIYDRITGVVTGNATITGIFKNTSDAAWSSLGLTKIFSIGKLSRDYIDETTITVEVELSQSVKAGFEYWIVNEDELTIGEPIDAVYSFIPDRTNANGDRLSEEDDGYDDAIKVYNGELAVPIQSQTINAPINSLIFLAPGQTGAFDYFHEEVFFGIKKGLENSRP